MARPSLLYIGVELFETVRLILAHQIDEVQYLNGRLRHAVIGPRRELTVNNVASLVGLVEKRIFSIIMSTTKKEEEEEEMEIN